MQRYFASLKDNYAVLDEDQIFHIEKVMRMKVGDEFELVSEGKVHLMKINSFKPLTAVKLRDIEEDNELPNKLTLIFSPIKGDHTELVLQKCTELGVTSFVLLNTSRTVVKIDNSSKKLDRFNKIILEASEQSKREYLPCIDKIINVAELGSINADIKLIAYENFSKETDTFFKELNKIKGNESVAVIIGPEGGFSEEEVKKAQELGYVPISLGKRILRAETASINVISVISNYLERK